MINYVKQETPINNKNKTLICNTNNYILITLNIFQSYKIIIFSLTD